MSESLWTVEGVARYFAVTTRTVYRMVNDRTIPGYKVGGQWRFQPREIKAWVKRQHR